MVSDCAKDTGFVKKYLTYCGTDNSVAHRSTTLSYEIVADDRFSETVRSEKICTNQSCSNPRSGPVLATRQVSAETDCCKIGWNYDAHWRENVFALRIAE
jgi:hypothetical protein